MEALDEYFLMVLFLLYNKGSELCSAADNVHTANRVRGFPVLTANTEALTFPFGKLFLALKSWPNRGRVSRQVKAGFQLALNLRFVWPFTSVDLR